jgi:hypothetical protein
MKQEGSTGTTATQADVQLHTQSQQPPLEYQMPICFCFIGMHQYHTHSALHSAASGGRSWHTGTRARETQPVAAVLATRPLPQLNLHICAHQLPTHKAQQFTSTQPSSFINGTLHKCWTQTRHEYVWQLAVRCNSPRHHTHGQCDSSTGRPNKNYGCTVCCALA